VIQILVLKVQAHLYLCTSVIKGKLKEVWIWILFDNW